MRSSAPRPPLALARGGVRRSVSPRRGHCGRRSPSWRPPTRPGVLPTPHFLAERYALREAEKVPGQWLPQRNAPETGPTEEANNEAELVALGWAVPWERERTRRLVGLGYEAGPPNNYGRR